MLFHTFSSQDERRNFGGSDFIEIQHCRLPQQSELETIVSVDAVSHWQNDSLYISGDDMDAFYEHYGSIITGGTYNNGECGPMDLFGINFYSREQASMIAERLKTETPQDYQILLKWMQSGVNYIGFYVLGV